MSSGSVYVFGSGDCGQLGLGESVLWQARPARIDFFEGKDIIDVSAGGIHNLSLSSDGSVYSWGCNDDGALGHALPEWSIGKVEIPNNEKIVKVSCGDSVSVAVSESGKVYSWGTFRDSGGLIGYNENQMTQPKPVLLDRIADHKVIDISAGSNHVVALTDNFQILSWGSGEQGQLGRRILSRRKLKSLQPTNVTMRRKKPKKPFSLISCGSYHTLALTGDSSIYSWGLNNHGQLGTGDCKDCVVPTKIDIDERFEGLCAGEHHSVGLTEDGVVYCWGRGDYGQLGIADVLMSPFPSKVLESSFRSKVTKIASGDNHCLAADEENNVYTWGFGEMYQLGNEKDEDSHECCMINFKTREVLKLDGGGQHSIVLCTM